jgi:hypothetical protein
MRAVAVGIAVRETVVVVVVLAVFLLLAARETVSMACKGNPTPRPLRKDGDVLVPAK